MARSEDFDDLLAEAGLSVPGVADAAMLSRQSVYDIRYGKSYPRPRTLRDLARALRMETDRVAAAILESRRKAGAK